MSSYLTHRRVGFVAVAVTAWVFASCRSEQFVPTEGRYFYRAQTDSCETFVLDENLETVDVSFCPGAARVEDPLLAPPMLVCASGPRYGFTTTLEGFALIRDRQVHVFVFQTRGACEQGLPPARDQRTL